MGKEELANNTVFRYCFDKFDTCNENFIVQRCHQIR